MTTSVLLGRMLAAGAVVEAAAGLGLLLVPSTLAELLFGIHSLAPGRSSRG